LCYFIYLFYCFFDFRILTELKGSVRISNSFVLGNYRENVLYSFVNYSSHRFCIILIGLSPNPRAACSLIPFTADFRNIIRSLLCLVEAEFYSFPFSSFRAPAGATCQSFLTPVICFRSFYPVFDCRFRSLVSACRFRTFPTAVSVFDQYLSVSGRRFR
jgi:hypothetical protein